MESAALRCPIFHPKSTQNTNELSILSFLPQLLTDIFVLDSVFTADIIFMLLKRIPIMMATRLSSFNVKSNSFIVKLQSKA